MNIGNQISAIRKEQQLTQEHLDTLIKEDSKMVKTIDKERVLGKIKKEKSIIEFFTGAGTGIIVSCLLSPDSIRRTVV